MGVKENEAALMRAVEAWNSGDVNSYLELYGEGIRLHAGNYDFPNKAAVDAMYKGMFAATSEIHLNMLETFGQDEKLCARYSLDARHTGKLMGIEPTGRQFSMIGITVMHFEDGKVVERWDIDNSSEVFADLRN
jgi:predicted ester cyclase